MRQVILSGGNQGNYRFADNPPTMIYGFEYLAEAFDPNEWDVHYIDRACIFTDPEPVMDAELVLMVTEKSMTGDLETEEGVALLQSAGVKMVACPNGGIGHIILHGSPDYHRWLHRFDAVLTASENSRIIEAYEKLVGRPIIHSGLPPYVKSTIDKQLSDSDVSDVEFPDDVGECFVMGKKLTMANMITYDVARGLGIPLIITVWDEFSQPWIDFLKHEDNTIRVIPCPNHNDWLKLLKLSRGVFQLTPFISGGRHCFYAACAGKVSLTSGHAWQEALFLEAVLSPDIFGGARWRENADLLEQEAVPTMHERLDWYSPENRRPKMGKILERIL